MTDVHSLLQNAQLVVFVATAIVGLRLWLRHRSQPAAYLAAAFGTLGTVLLVSRLVPDDATGLLPALVQDLAITGLAVFAWLFARFAWSFERRTPSWLRAAAVAVVALAVWTLVMPPLPEGDVARSGMQSAYVVVFIGVWAVLTVAAAAKLWRAGGGQQLVRARMRVMAAGALVLTVALLLAGSAGGGEASGLDLVIQVLAVASAVLFLVGFAPPRPLRMWWRRRATSQWQHMQLDLIAAATPDEVASAAVPVIADVLGSGTAVVTGDGRLLAVAGMSDSEAAAVADAAARGTRRGEGEKWVEVAGSWLVVTVTPYTPLFGQDEEDILAGFALQMRLALERAQLFQANEQARRELERSQDETQSMMVGLAHDLRGPMVGITGYTGLLRDTDDTDERAMMLDRIDANSQHLTSLVDSLVELSRAGRTQTEREPVDLDDILDKVVSRLATSYPGATVLSEGLPVVDANPLAMEQLFENLLTNAAKHGGRDDITIRLGHTTEDGVAHVSVVDDGRGVPADEREAVFAPFRRGRHAGGAGSGVGLGMVRRIVESHGGHIALEDSEVGAHFRIELPAAAAGTAPDA